MLTSGKFLALAIVGVLLFSSCSVKPDKHAVPVAGGSLVDLQTFAAGSPSHIDPALADTVQSAQIAHLLYDGLTKADDRGIPQNAVAEEITSNSNSTLWTFRFREGVTFTNGEAVKPSNFKFAWERALRPELGSKLVNNFDVIAGFENVEITGELSGVVANDEMHTLVVSLNKPFVEFPSLVSLPVFSPLPKNGFTEPWDSGVMVGNGPFKMKSAWQPGRQIVLYRNDAYYGGPNGGRALLNEITFKISKDIASSYVDFESGGGDVVRIPAPANRSVVARDKDAIVNNLLMAVEYWGFNLNNPIVGGDKNLKLRQAIALAVNKAEIVSKVYGGSREIATAWAPPSTPGYLPTGVTVDHNIERAKRLITEWAETPPVLKVSFEAGVGHEEKAALIVENLKEIGIVAELDPVSQQSYDQAIAAGTLQFFRGFWSAEHTSYDNMLYPLFHSNSVGSRNAFGYEDKEFDSLLDEARAEKDVDKRQQLYRKAESTMLSSQVVVPIDWTTASLAKSNRVHDLKVQPLGYVAYDEVWVD